MAGAMFARRAAAPVPTTQLDATAQVERLERRKGK
jgi:hypothetical protein